MKFRPLQIPGKSIKPPDPVVGIRCGHCGKTFQLPKKQIDSRTGKVTLVCPYCGHKLR